MALNSTIRTLRAQHNLTQDDIANALSISRNSVTAWEKGITSPSIKNLNLLCKLFNVTMNELFDDDTTPSLSTTLPPIKKHQSNITEKTIKVPIRGYAQGDYISVGNTVKKPIGFLDLAPSFSNIVGLYAVYITGDSMSPAHDHGDTRLIAPHAPCKIGDTVVIVKKASGDKPETSYIKIYLEKRTLASGKVMLHFNQHNPEAELIFEQDAIIQMHKVLTYNEILGL